MQQILSPSWQLLQGRIQIIYAEIFVTIFGFIEKLHLFELKENFSK